VIVEEGEEGGGRDRSHPVIGAHRDALGEEGEGNLGVVELLQAVEVVEGGLDEVEED
jgi:hypothetical protein